MERLPAFRGADDIMANSKKDIIKKLWCESFDDSREFVERYFSEVYADADAMTLEEDGTTVSGLLLQPYGFRFADSLLTAGYVAGASTSRASRGRGFMRRLMREAYSRARERGMALCVLVPATPMLFAFYEKCGMATVFFNRVLRFTSLHEFVAFDQSEEAEWLVVQGPAERDVLFSVFSELEARHSGVQHSAAQFGFLYADLMADGGVMAAVEQAGGGAKAVVAAVPGGSDGDVVVKALYGTGLEAMREALRFVRNHFGKMAVVVNAAPDGSDAGGDLSPYGMARIVNAELLLGAMASANPGLKLALRLADEIVPDNSHIYIVGGGRVRIDDSYDGRLDYDVDTPTFTRLLFSSQALADVLGLGCERPDMRLMIE